MSSPEVLQAIQEAKAKGASVWDAVYRLMRPKYDAMFRERYAGSREDSIQRGLALLDRLIACGSEA